MPSRARCLFARGRGACSVPLHAADDTCWGHIGVGGRRSLGALMPCCSSWPEVPLTISLVDWIASFPVASRASTSSARRAWERFARAGVMSTSWRSSTARSGVPSLQGSEPCTRVAGPAVLHDVALRRRWPLVCNGIYLQAGDLSMSPLEVIPLAGHVTGRFRVATREGFDVNPVTWQVLAHHSIAIRGPDRERLPIRTDEGELRAWTLANLNGYWRRWVERARHGGLKHERRPAAAPRRVRRARRAKAALHDRHRRDRDQGSRRELRLRGLRAAVARADRGRPGL